MTNAPHTASGHVTQENAQDLPTSPQDLLNQLEKLNISYDLHKHEAVFTVAESDKVNAEIPGAHCRNLFLRDKKKKNYLVVALNETEIDLKKLQALIGSDRLSFGSADRLWEFLGVRPGSVCPFALVNDTDHKVQVILDSDMMDRDVVNYHPLLNTMTVGIKPSDLIRFVESTGHSPNITDLKAAAPDLS